MLRHFLHISNESELKIESTKLNISRSYKSIVHEKSSSTNSLSLDSSISAIKGVGLKQAERLSALGLILIRDLLNYFPRDYVDYTSLKTINKTEVGENVKIE